ncbi:MAG: GTPase ObgE [Deltaproteobacteria bacterium]|nr:GTPase ObgE [Deltaproteobacteria bacterium]
MHFVDETTITAVSGNGGRGCVSFRRERFIPKGGPDGGNGGDGGDVLIKASKNIHSFADFKSRRHFRASNGKHGQGQNRTGKNGTTLTIHVPVGTVVYDAETGEILGDLVQDNQEILIVPGGKGGKGNLHFVSSTNRVPRFAQPGIEGQTKKLRLSLKFLADIGLIGFPNAGKSTLLSRLTSARPHIDQYPFTTIIPNLGVMELEDQRTFTIADIPGLIEGAGEGKGLGHRFLKHIERTRFLIHLLDITYTPKGDILEDFHTIQNEIDRYNPAINEKDQMVVINKMDIASQGPRDIKDIQKALKRMGIDALPISALTGEGLKELRRIISKRL